MSQKSGDTNGAAEKQGQNDGPLEMKVYIKPGCPWCIAVVAWLEDNDYDFTKIDVINNQRAYDEMVELSGQSLAPTMTYGKLMLADFGVDELEDFLDEHGICAED